MFRRILAATDSLDRQDAPALTAFQWARHFGAGLVVLHVLETQERDAGPGNDRDLRAARRLAVLYEAAGAGRLAFEPIVSEGCPWEEILRTGRETAADLIVVGPHRGAPSTHGRVRPMGRLGSTAAGILTREVCPVLIANHPPPAGPVRLETVLVGIDFSPASEGALRFAAGLAAAAGARVAPVHVLPVPPYPKYTQRDFEADRRVALDRLHRLCRRHAPAAADRCRVRGGARPADDLLSAAGSLEAGLVVLGSHGRDGGGKWYPGSVVETAASRAPCPVVVVNAPGALRPWAPERRSKRREDTGRDPRILVFSDRVEAEREKETPMENRKIWRRYRLVCPESGRPVSVLTEWEDTLAGMELTGMSCDRPELRDLGGRACGWRCWERLFRRK